MNQAYGRKSINSWLKRISLAAGRLPFSGFRSALIMLAILLGFSHLTMAEPITPQQAHKAVSNWLRTRSHSLDWQLGRQVARIETVAGKPVDARYYVAHLEPRGVVIVSSDDRIEPIIAFSAEEEADLSPGSPFGALLRTDLKGRIEAAQKFITAGAQRTAEAEARAVSLTEANDACRTRWHRLLNSAESPAGETGPAAQPSGENIAADPQVTLNSGNWWVWIEPFVKTKWGQGDDEGAPLYNYYTPNHYSCGCVATSMAQILKHTSHYMYPAIGVWAFQCEFDGYFPTYYTRGGDGEGGPYDWNGMPDDPDESITTAQREQIGALCYDVAISLETAFYPTDSTAYFSRAATSMQTVFGVANVARATDSWDISELIEPMILPNLMGHTPVMLGIYRWETGYTLGHSVLVDGYAIDGPTFDEGTPYYHLNMGWRGTHDTWYQLPTIQIDPDHNYKRIGTCIYNIQPWPGEIIAGRVTDYAGRPIEAIVTADDGTNTYSGNSWLNGFYAIRGVPSDTTVNVNVEAENRTFSSQTISTGRSSLTGGLECGNIMGLDFRDQAGAPPIAHDMSNEISRTSTAGFCIRATDDGLPHLPGEPGVPVGLTYTIQILPAFGMVNYETSSGEEVSIDTVPFTLPENAWAVKFRVAEDEELPDRPAVIGYVANDGGLPPHGGDSQLAWLKVQILGQPLRDNVTIPDLLSPELLQNMDTYSSSAIDLVGSAGMIASPIEDWEEAGDPTSPHTDLQVISDSPGQTYPPNMTEPMFIATKPINCRGFTNLHLSFYRWLGISQNDLVRIMVSNDGQNWRRVWQSYETVEDSEWTRVEYDISDIADDRETVYVRWQIGPTDGYNELAGWNIDDIEIAPAPCTAPTDPKHPRPLAAQTSIPPDTLLVWNRPSPVPFRLLGSASSGTYGLFELESDPDEAVLVGPNEGYSFSMDFAPNGKLYGASGRLYKIDPDTGTMIELGAVNDDWGYVGLSKLAFHPDGTCYIFNTSDRLYRVNLDTMTATVIGTAPYDVKGFDFAADGTMYVSAGTWIFTMDPDDASILTTVCSTSTTGIDCAPDGYIYAAYGVGPVKRIDPQTGEVTYYGDYPYYFRDLASQTLPLETEDTPVVDPNLNVAKVMYDVYLDTQNPPVAQVAVGWPQAVYAPTGLQPNTTYYWRVVAHNDCRQETGPVWSFTTGDGGVPGDFDGDGHIDRTDFELFQACQAGPMVAIDPANLPAGCTLSPDDQGYIAADLDQDHDVDAVDFAIFQRCYSGPNLPADPDCR